MFVWSCGRGRSAGRPTGRTSGWTSGRTVVGGAHVVSGAVKKTFDRGGSFQRFAHLDRMLRSTVYGGRRGALPQPPKTGSSGGQRPPAKTDFSILFQNSRNFSKEFAGSPPRWFPTLCGNMTMVPGCTNKTNL